MYIGSRSGEGWDLKGVILIFFASTKRQMFPFHFSSFFFNCALKVKARLPIIDDTSLVVSNLSLSITPV